MEEIMGENMKSYAKKIGLDLVEVKPIEEKLYINDKLTLLTGHDVLYLLDVMYEITKAESPMDMYDLAVSALKKYGKEPAKLNN